MQNDTDDKNITALHDPGISHSQGFALDEQSLNSFTYHDHGFKTSLNNNITYNWSEEQIILLYLLHLTSTSFKYSHILKETKCFNFADRQLLVTVETKIVITKRTPLTSTSKMISFKSNSFHSLSSATQSYKPGAARWYVGTRWGCDTAWSPPSPPLKLLAYYKQQCLLDQRADKD